MAKAKPIQKCSLCDGTGRICNICGFAPTGCECDEAEVENYQKEYKLKQYSLCDDCGGTGQ